MNSRSFSSIAIEILGDCAGWIMLLVGAAAVIISSSRWAWHQLDGPWADDVGENQNEGGDA